MSTPKDKRQKDLFRPTLDSIIDLKHPLVLLAQRIDWTVLERRLGSVYRPGPGQPPLPVWLIAGLMILKHMESLSDEALCARFLDSPDVQFFSGEVSFRHDLPFDRSSLTRWRTRLELSRPRISSRSPSTPRFSPRRWLIPPMPA
jgi:transposase, IS5 family